MKKNYSKFTLALVKEQDFAYENISKIDSPEVLYKEFEKAFKMSTQAEEIVAMMCLSTKGDVTGAFEVSRGSLTASVVHPREIYKRAMLCNANKIVIAHNHPSGYPDPSEQDIEITKRLSEAGDILGIELLDHLIIGDDTFQSLRRMGTI